MKKTFYTIAAMLFINIVHAGETPKQTVIEGRIANGRSDTLTLSFYVQKLGITTAGVRIQKQISPTGKFKFILPDFKGIAYFSLQSSQWPRIYLDNYLVEPGDSIYVMVNPEGIPVSQNIIHKGLFFTGRNVGKCQARILDDSIRARFTDSVGRKGYVPENPESGIDSLLAEFNQRRNAFELPRITNLDKFKRRLSDLSYNVMKADILYQRQQGLLDFVYDHLGAGKKYKDSAEWRKLLMDIYDNRLAKDIMRNRTDRLARNHSVTYLDFLVRLGMTAVRLADTTWTLHKAVDYFPYYKDLAGDNYEKALTGFAAYVYTFNYRTSEVDSFVRRAMNEVTDPYFQSVLQGYFDRLQKGRPVFSFSFPDQTGKMVSSQSLLGKAYLLDFWWTGCLPCMALAERMRTVKELLKDRKDILFVSVSLDTSREQWLKSVGTNKYTDEGNINLFTGGLGTEHPFWKYYYFTGVPTMLLVDAKGQIYSSTPPRPDRQENIDNLLQMLRAAAQSR